ncbi:DNA repair protein RecO (recombination protein O) [Dysgonomonas sp. PFB1-18]|uniref:DNA repair protein RecO n=1 Tax=unclassified Dysgonomonas TaxID=2630389 RepID=UPI002474A210|nr:MULTISPECIES: DNA repair protein RecO [unclassified Dysgonomonas]MDH6307930.1 DNA repair protein RecO (recombination protein O) [Dysgonomonas sp. PF1-14]MDH6337848.1 DNA repair protein RecO (recombination protein O) [Dysgonomonas sp. PF1-16]MDH6379072.1 DNA repair protein RecO (recombination protein O) [Dysgonomonas sp. PFB1-18]MDH6396707.1 DNA repair protein RecO (recombination protein O) [Dysgonomonas sp. PF1-23]
MQYKTRGLVLSTINYNDKYVLVQIFTESFGRVTYMVSKAKGKNTKAPKSLFSPLALLDLEVEHQASRDIQRIREARSELFLYDISGSLSKTSMAFFLSEFLSRVLRDTNDSQLLFSFLEQSVQILEITDKSIANYHLVFMLKLSHFMGFYPNLEEYRENSLFDMINGEFITYQPLHKHFLNRTDSKALSLLARISFENMHRFVFSRQDRINIINKILEYYRLHLYDFPALKSLDVLHELF